MKRMWGSNETEMFRFSAEFELSFTLLLNHTQPICECFQGCFTYILGERGPPYHLLQPSDHIHWGYLSLYGIILG